MNKKLYITGGLLAVVLLVGAGCTKTDTTETAPAQEPTQEVSQKDTAPTPTPTQPKQEPKPVVQEPTKSTPSPTPIKPKVEEPKEVSVAANCDAFPDKLSSCTKYKCQFVHPFTGETMQKEITGIVGGKCNYIEQMPNNGKMECNYTTSQRTAAAQYYKDVAVAESNGTSMNLNLGSGEQKTTYTIDGKEVENPLQTFMTDGTCVISGY